MKITKRQLRRIILESALDAPFEWEDKEYTVTERKPSRHKGVQNGKPMDLVIWDFLNPDKGGPGSGSMDIPKGMDLEEYLKSGGKEGFPDYYRKPETGADMNRAIKAAEERGDWDNRRQSEGTSMKITKRQLRRIIREEKRKVLAERKVRRIVRRRLMEQAGTLASEGDLVSAIKGKDIKISMGGSGMQIDIQGETSYNADDVLGQMWEEMGPEGALQALEGSARSVSIDPDTAEDLGLSGSDKNVSKAGYWGPGGYHEY